jgi:hypothetical protein
MHNSILTDIKKMLGIMEDDESFDTDIIILINDAFHRLNQLGVGPTKGYSIESKDDTWEDFWCDLPPLPTVPVYIYLKVKKVFDPPTGGAIESINRMIEEKEFLMNLDVDPTPEEIEVMNVPTVWGV